MAVDGYVPLTMAAYGCGRVYASNNGCGRICAQGLNILPTKTAQFLSPMAVDGHAPLTMADYGCGR
eukprot:7647266-Pyramimonas_sp.AAC.1